MNRVLITGATGLIGKNIVKKCHEQNIDVHYLTTSKHKIEIKDNYKGFYWNPNSGEIDASCLDEVSTIINLAGSSIAKRWTSSYKKEIIRSRIDTISLLYKTIKENHSIVEQFISASAIGIYPTSLTTYYNENTIIDDDSSFIVDAVKQWEVAINRFKDLNIKVTKVRIGLVLSNKGGALMAIKKPIYNFVGANLGTGKQWQSWIHIDDLSNLFLFILENRLEGVYNGVAPNSVTHNFFTKLIAKLSKRPLWLPNIPEFVLKLILGEMHILVTKGQRVSSEKIETLGFQFKYKRLENALDNLL